VTRLSGTSLIIQLLEFFGTIKRGFDSDGVPVIYGKIKVLDGFIYALAATQDVLGKRLDALVLMVLDEGLHSDAGVYSVVADMTCFLNLTL
jgi:hypothetical protein